MLYAVRCANAIKAQIRIVPWLLTANSRRGKSWTKFQFILWIRCFQISIQSIEWWPKAIFSAAPPRNRPTRPSEQKKRGKDTEEEKRKAEEEHPSKVYISRITFDFLIISTGLSVWAEVYSIRQINANADRHLIEVRIMWPSGPICLFTIASIISRRECCISFLCIYVVHSLMLLLLLCCYWNRKFTFND